MIAAEARQLGAGTRVRVRTPGTVPSWSTWDDDRQRTSTPVKKRLQELFFKGDKRVRAEIIYIANETERERLRARSLCKVELRDPSGASVVVLADSRNLVAG